MKDDLDINKAIVYLGVITMLFTMLFGVLIRIN